MHIPAPLFLRSTYYKLILDGIFIFVRYSNPKLQFFYHDHPDGNICTLVLPANAPFHQIGSAPQPSKEAAKRDACLKACQALHEVGALTDYLLPEQDVNYEDLDLTDSDNEDCQCTSLVVYSQSL